mmetsp:Transcript_11485/g.16990  ORF Transcript_11485/g.16990 Transcript_11485/m.16990 type:complete len:108 (-) Transcript_11485:2750-3073(-)
MKISHQLKGGSNHGYNYGIRRVNTKVTGAGLNGYKPNPLQFRINGADLALNIKAAIKWAPVAVFGLYWVVPHFNFFASNAWKALKGEDIKPFPEKKDTYTFTDASDM